MQGRSKRRKPSEGNDLTYRSSSSSTGKVPKSLCPQLGAYKDNTSFPEPGSGHFSCHLDSPPRIHPWFWEGSLPVNYHFPLSISCISDEDTAHTVSCNNQVTSSQTPANPGFSVLIQKRISGRANMKQRRNLLNEILIEM